MTGLLACGATSQRAPSVDAPVADVNTSGIDADATDGGAADGVAGAADGLCTPDAGAASCDDDNPCTVDTANASCACVHEPAPDGTACSDGDVCTGSDQCSAGRCAGMPVASAARVLGSLTSFGGSPGLQTIVALASEDRAVFLSGRTLSLVSIADPMQVLDVLDTGVQVRSDDVNPMVWVQRPRTFLIPLTDRLIARINNLWGIDLYDLQNDRLTPSERYGFTTLDGQVYGAAGRGEQLWTCATGQVQSYSVSASSHEILKGGGLILPAGHSCLGLTLSPDGNVLLAATTGGLDLIDVNTKTVKSTALAGKFLLDVAASPTWIAAYSLEEMYTGFGSVAVLTPDATTLTSTFSYQTGVTAPIGFAALGGSLLLQRARWPACTAYAAEVYGPSAAPPVVGAPWISLDACRSSYGGVPVHTVALGSHAVLEPNHQLVRADAATGDFTRLTGPRQGAFERVRALDANTVEVHGAWSMSQVDITRPEAPVATRGGLVLPTNAERLALELAPGAPLSLLTTGDQTNAVGPLTTLYWSAADGGLPTVAGSIANDDEAGPWIAAGQFLYQLSIPKGDAKDSGPLRLRRFPAVVTREDRQHLQADADRSVTITATADLDRRLGTSFGADPATHDVVIVDARGSTKAPSVAQAIVQWLKWDGHAYQAMAADTQAGHPVGVLLAGGRSVLAFDDGVAFVGPSALKTSIKLDPAALSVERLLALTDHFVYLGVRGTLGGPSDPSPGVLVLRADDLSEVARYATSESVTSVAEVGARLAFGATATLTIAAPNCSAR